MSSNDAPHVCKVSGEESATSIADVSDQETYLSTSSIEVTNKNSQKNRSFRQTLRNYFRKKAPKNSPEAEAHMNFLYNTSIDDFRTHVECNQPIRFIVSDNQLNIPSPLTSINDGNVMKMAHLRQIEQDNNNKQLVVYNKTSVLIPEASPSSSIVPPANDKNKPAKRGRLSRSNKVRRSKSACKAPKNQVETTTDPAKDLVNESTTAEVGTAPNIIPTSFGTEKSTSTMQPLTPISVGLEKSTSTMKALSAIICGLEKSTLTEKPTTSKCAKARPINPKKSNITVNRERQAELHRLKVEIEKKRLELLELKLTKEREEIMHERVKFEKDLEYKEIAITQLKDETNA